MSSEAQRYAAGFGVSLEGEVVARGRKEFLVPGPLKEFTSRVPLDPVSIGVPLGETTPKGFRPSFALLDLLKGSSRRVVIGDEAEWLFTCGRDAFVDKVLEEHDSAGVFLVLNRRGEVLGLGRKERDGKRFVIKNLFDRGDFLHREDGKRRKRR